MTPRLPVTEGEFQQAVVQMGMLRGWHVAHFRPARTAKGWRTPMQGHKGFPDLVLARDGMVLHVELKSDKGKLSLDQLEWRRKMGVHYKIWRPSDMEEIIATLR